MAETTVTIKDQYSEITLKREAESLEEMLDLLGDALRGLGFNFKGELTIEESE